MIIFHRLWATMESRGISMYQLREKCGIDSKTIRRLRANENIETKTLDKLCSALHCNLDDIAEYKKEFAPYITKIRRRRIVTPFSFFVLGFKAQEIWSL